MINKESLLKIKQRDYFKKENSFIINKKIESELIIGNEKLHHAFISIVIPSYHRIDSLKRALESAVNQMEYTDYCIIVVSNNSEFENESSVVQMIKEFNSDKILYYRNRKNLGAMGNWNRCIELAKSEWVCMLHDDDVLHPLHLKMMSSIVLKNCDIKCLTCGMKVLNYIKNPLLNAKEEMKKVVIEEKPNIIKQDYLNYTFKFPGLLLGALLKREYILEMGGFQTIGVPSVEDRFFMARYSYYFNVYSTNISTYGYAWEMNASLNIEVWQDILVNEYYFNKQLCNIRKGVKKWILKKYNKIYIYRKAIQMSDAKSVHNGKHINMHLLCSQCEISGIDLVLAKVINTIFKVK